MESLDRIRRAVAGRSPSSAATFLLLDLGIEQAPVDVVRVCRQLGVRVFEGEVPASDGVHTALARADKDGDGAPRIVVSRASTPTRKRFSIAHELGHLLMHGDGVFYRSRGYSSPADPTERQADRFAAHLLMPLWMLSEGRGWMAGLTEAQLAQHFGVSRKALELQLRELI